MEGICCICRKSIGVARVATNRVLASFTLSHYGLCPTCLSRTRADIFRIYGPTGPGLGKGQVAPTAGDKGPGA